MEGMEEFAAIQEAALAAGTGPLGERSYRFERRRCTVRPIDCQKPTDCVQGTKERSRSGSAPCTRRSPSRSPPCDDTLDTLDNAF
eukprot:576949-Prorocentrum_minimum.AAC.1